MYTLQICYPQNVRDFEFDLSRPFKVKCDVAVGLPIYVSY